MCSPTWETHIPSEMCSPTWETHIPIDMCSPSWETQQQQQQEQLVYSVLGFCTGVTD